jgi:hypothetical protein
MRAVLPASLLVLAAAAFAPAPLPRREPRGVFVERFAEPAGDATRGYRSFDYETTVRGCKADVSGGRLRLHGDHQQAGDQRLFITAQRATGKASWPDSLEVTARLGGTARDNVGVSVGRVKILFHPNFEGGAFRAETADTHEEFFGNQDVGFTPAAGVAHLMTVRVRRTERGYRFDVTLEDAKGGGRHRKSFEVSDRQMGRFDRVGLERSGRRGGDALFESLTIRPGGR